MLLAPSVLDDPRIRVDRRHQILCMTARNRGERQQSSARAIERCSRTTATAGHTCFLIVAVTPPDVPLTLADQNKHPRSVCLFVASISPHYTLELFAFSNTWSLIDSLFDAIIYVKLATIFDDSLGTSFPWSSISKTDKSNFTDIRHETTDYFCLPTDEIHDHVSNENWFVSPRRITRSLVVTDIIAVAAASLLSAPNRHTVCHVGRRRAILGCTDYYCCFHR